jgi:hypothetical protein
VTQHVLSYRDTQWAYFSCYRNLAVLGVPGGLLWLVLIWRDGSPWWALSFLAGVAVGELVLFRSMKALLGGYYAITKAVSS